MDFFDTVEPPDPSSPPTPPPWVRRPPGDFAGLHPDRRVLARGDHVVVVLSHVDVHEVGCVLPIRGVVRRPEGMDEEAWHARVGSLDGHAAVRHRRHSRTALRFGVVFPDGSRSVPLQWVPGQDEPPTSPVLLPRTRGVSAGPRHGVVSQRLWLWPVPPPEPFDLVLQWRDLGIDETWVVLDGAAIVDAAGDRPRFE